MGKAKNFIAGGLGVGAAAKAIFGKKGKGGQGDPNAEFFDITKEVTPFQQQQAALGAQSQAAALGAGAQSADVLSAMGRAALGQGPSLAEAQLKAAQDRTLAQQLAAAQAGRGGGAASNQRALMQAMGTQGRDLAQAAAQERLAERDRFLAASNQAQGLARQDVQGGFNLAVAPKRERQEAELARAQADMARTQARKQQQGQVLGNVIGAGAMLLSDKTMKKQVKGSEKDMKSFVDKLAAKSYDYKDTSMPGTAPGKRFGIIAQDLEKSKVGKSMVVDTPQGKMVDYGQGFGAILASQAELNKRLKKLEGKKG